MPSSIKHVLGLLIIVSSFLHSVLHKFEQASFCLIWCFLWFQVSFQKLCFLFFILSVLSHQVSFHMWFFLSFHLFLRSFISEFVVCFLHFSFILFFHVNHLLVCLILFCAFFFHVSFVCSASFSSAHKDLQFVQHVLLLLLVVFCFAFFGIIFFPCSHQFCLFSNFVLGGRNQGYLRKGTTKCMFCSRLDHCVATEILFSIQVVLAIYHQISRADLVEHLRQPVARNLDNDQSLLFWIFSKYGCDKRILMDK